MLRRRRRRRPHSPPPDLPSVRPEPVSSCGWKTRGGKPLPPRRRSGGGRRRRRRAGVHTEKRRCTHDRRGRRGRRPTCFLQAHPIGSSHRQLDERRQVRWHVLVEFPPRSFSRQGTTCASMCCTRLNRVYSIVRIDHRQAPTSCGLFATGRGAASLATSLGTFCTMDPDCMQLPSRRADLVKNTSPPQRFQGGCELASASPRGGPRWWA